MRDRLLKQAINMQKQSISAAPAASLRRPQDVGYAISDFGLFPINQGPYLFKGSEIRHPESEIISFCLPVFRRCLARLRFEETDKIAWVFFPDLPGNFIYSERCLTQ